MQREAEQPLPTWADPRALGFIAIAICIFSAVPFITGWVHPMSAIATIPWGIAAFIALIIVTIILFRNGSFMPAMSFSIFGIILCGAMILKAVQSLMMLLNGVTAPPQLAAGGMIVEGMAWVVMGIVIIAIGFLAGYISRPFAIFIWIADVGVWIMTAASFGGIPPAAAAAGGYLVFLLGIWFLYMGIAELVNGTVRRVVVPLGKPMFKRPAPPQA